MKKLTKTVKKMLDALAYADAAEYLTPREKNRILAQNPGTIRQAPPIPEPVKAETGSSARRVALYLGNELPAEVMSYAIQTCARLRHELTVLTFEPETIGDAMLEPHRGAFKDAGIDMRLVTLTGEPMSGLARYLRGHPEIAFLVCKESGYLGHSYMNGTQRKNALPVPVVVVAAEANIPREQDLPASDLTSDNVVVA